METKKASIFDLGASLILHLMLYCVRGVATYAVALLPIGGALPYVVWLVNALGTVAMFLLPTAYYLRCVGCTPANIFRPSAVNGSEQKISVAEIIFAASATLCAVNLAGALTEVVIALLGLPTGEASTLPNGVGLQILMFVSSVLIAPFMEELLFRGAVLNAYGAFGTRTAVLMSATLFALMHYSLYSLPYAFCAGCIIALFALRTRSLWIAMGLHFLNNLTTYIALAVEKYAGVTAYSMFGAVMLAILAATALVSGGIIAIRYVRGCSKASMHGCEGKRIGGIRSVFCSETVVYIIAAAIACVYNEIWG